MSKGSFVFDPWETKEDALYAAAYFLDDMLNKNE